jgi:hypothetical protein
MFPRYAKRGCRPNTRPCLDGECPQILRGFALCILIGFGGGFENLLRQNDADLFSGFEVSRGLDYRKSASLTVPRPSA